MTLNIEQSAFIALIANEFKLSDWETTVLESTVDQYYRSNVNNNALLDKRTIHIEVITFGSLLWIKPDLDLDHVKVFISKLYNDENRINRNLESIKRIPAHFTQKWRDLKNIKILPSLAMSLNKE